MLLKLLLLLLDTQMGLRLLPEGSSSSSLDAGKAAVETAAATLVAANRDLFLLASVFRHPAPAPAPAAGRVPWRLGMLLLLLPLLLLPPLLLILLLLPLPGSAATKGSQQEAERADRCQGSPNASRGPRPLLSSSSPPSAPGPHSYPAYSARQSPLHLRRRILKSTTSDGIPSQNSAEWDDAVSP